MPASETSLALVSLGFHRDGEHRICGWNYKNRGTEYSSVHNIRVEET